MRQILVISSLLVSLLGCDIAGTESEMPADLSGRWLGSITQPGGSRAEVFEFRLELTQTDSQLVGVSTSRELVNPRAVIMLELDGFLDEDGSFVLQEGDVIHQDYEPCIKRMTLSLSTANAGQLSGNWLTPSSSGCGGVINLQREESVSHTVWPTAPEHNGVGFDDECGDWEGPAAYYWLSPNGWRDAQPFRRHRKDGFGYHLGADWNFGSSSDDMDAPVYAIAYGTVSSVHIGGNDEYGNVIFVLHELPIGTFTSMYAHVNWFVPDAPPSVGQEVDRGDPIARIGNANEYYGASYHLHLEVRSGNNVERRDAYSRRQTGKTPQDQVDPNVFIETYR